MSEGRPLDFSISCRVGRLIESRVGAVHDVEEVARMQEMMLEAFALASSGAIICADWRKTVIFSPPVGDAMLDLLRRGNRAFERSAVLLSHGDALFGLQVERLLREAQNPRRRSFRDAEAMLAWLGEVMSPAERYRAGTFLAEAPG